MASFHRTSRAYHALRTLALLTVALVVIGCGDTSDNGAGVFTGSESGAALPPGSLTFNFVRTQNALEVPLNTVQIRFRFYSGESGSGTLLQEELFPYADSITIDPVEGASRSVVITVISTDGYPVFQATVNVTVVPESESPVDFANGTSGPVTILDFLLTPSSANIPAGGTRQFNASLSFSNGEVLPANNVVWSATGQVSVDANTGLVTATTDGSASVTATRDTQSGTADIIVGAGPVLTTLTVTPDGTTVGTGSQVPFIATGLDQNGVPFPLTDLAWTVESGTVTINSTSGLADCPTPTVSTIRATAGTLFDDASVTVLESVPAVVFGGTSTGVLNFTTTESPTIADMAGDITVTDNQPNLDGGFVNFSQGLPGNVADATFTIPATTLGTITDNGTSARVTFSANATPAAIAALIESTTINYGATTGTGTIYVDLNDGNGNDAMRATRAFSIADPAPPGEVWRVVSSGTTQDLFGVAFGNGRFVSVGLAGAILTSSDGETWAAQTLGTNFLFAVTYGNGQFVSVGQSGTILTSPDGVTWTAQSAGAYGGAFGGVTFGNGLFVSAGTGGGILTSPDGVVWTPRTSNTTQRLFGATFANGQFVVVGDNGTILTSSDGVTWSVQTSGTQRLFGVTFANGQFVNVGNAGTILTSPNGGTWTAQNSQTSQNLRSVTLGTGLVSVGGSGAILTSPDGVAWTDRTSATTTQGLNGVAFGNGLFVSTGNGGTIVISP